MCENVSKTFVIFGGTHSESGKESIWDPPAAAICHSHACDCHCTKYFLFFFLDMLDNLPADQTTDHIYNIINELSKPNIFSLPEYFLLSSDTYIGFFYHLSTDHTAS